ncbi:MAG: 50S ribosomal protein L15 [Candidatus Wolfebacteria bacterium]|nr:50S ribosomal protein L15 [Candidatus Wolfebacteria bacterium]
MQIHEIKITYKRKSVKRVGRGGKRGTTSGRGTKGQKARAGHRIRPAERDMIQRIPKLRGYKFKSLESNPIAINLGDLEKKVKANIINTGALIKSGLIKKGESVKILGNGELKRALEFQGLAVSASAIKKIEAAGGKVS